MSNKICENGRIFSVLRNDQYQNPEKMLPYLKSEIKAVVGDYLNLNGEVVVRYKLTQEGLLFMVEIPASSLKGVFSV